ncbi:FtsX-like permease family protein [Allocatelliglobosispora scoriae]|nr:FtsX-like permease family protein [Allocatelliglobosispora scoriae]
MRLVWGALRARRSQSLVVLALTALAVGIAAAAPWYFFAAGESVTQRYMSEAPESMRTVQVIVSPREAGRGLVPVDAVHKLVDDALGDGYESPVGGVSLAARLTKGTHASGAMLISREQACDRVILTGACPGPNEIMISDRTAAEFGIELGEAVVLPVERLTKPVAVKVVGIYQPADRADPYWEGIWQPATAAADPLFTDAQTLTGLKGINLTTRYHVRLTLAAYDGDLGRQLRAVKSGSQPWDVKVETDALVLRDKAVADQRTLSSGIIVSTVRFVLLAWFALLVVVRHTVSSRRNDIGLTKLRGVRWWRTWTMTLGQTMVLMGAGTVIGAAAGVLAVRIGVGPILLPEELDLAIVQSAELTGGVLLAVLTLAYASEFASLRLPVADLLRRVPARGRRRAVDVVELIFVVLMAIGVWQLTTVDASRYGTALAAVESALIAVVVGLLIARLTTWLGGVWGRWGIRAGRLVIALAGITARRRPALRWVVTLLVVAVAGFATTAGENVRADTVVAARAEQQLGAARVLSVAATSRSAVRDAVHAVDPAGTRAMAVSHVPASVGFTPALLAVESERMGSVMLWRDEYGPLPNLAPEPGTGAAQTVQPRLATGTATLDVTEEPQLHPLGSRPLPVPQGELPPEGPPPLQPSGTVSERVYVELRMITDAGRIETALAGPLEPGRHSYPVEVARCPGGCRIAGLGLVEITNGNRALPGWGTRVHLHSLAQANQSVIAPERFADRISWTTTQEVDGVGLDLKAESGGLSLTVPPGCAAGEERGKCVLTISPVGAPLRALATGDVFFSGRSVQARFSVSGGPSLPVTVRSQSAPLPRLGRVGAIVDLAAMDEAVGITVPGERLEVWLADPDDDAIVGELAKLGVITTGSHTVDALRDSLSSQAPAAVRRYQLWLFGFGLVIAAIALLLAARVEREHRAGELAALRAQGMRMSAVRRISLIGYGWPAALSVLAGLAVAMLASRLPVAVPEIFVDPWAVLPIPPPGVSSRALGFSALAATVVVAAAVLHASRKLVGAVSTQGGAR